MSLWHTLIVATKSHTKPSLICANSMKACKDSNNGKLQASLSKNLHITQVFTIQVGLLVCKEAIFTNKILYFVITFFVGVKIDMNLVFTFQKDLFTLMHMNSTSFVNSKCFLSKWAK
jgi:hypothetical protein